MYIEKINGPDDVKKIEVSELPKLAPPITLVAIGTPITGSVV